jgi:hypothetical protein
MTVSTTSQLRPLGMGKLLDQTIRFYRQNFFKFIGIIAIVQVPLMLLQLGMSVLTFSGLAQFQDFESTPSVNPFALFSPSYFLGMGGSVLLSLIAPILLYGLAVAALARLIARNHIGQSIDIIEAYREIGSQWGRLVAAMLVLFLLSLGLFIWLLIPCVGWFTGPGAMAFLGMAIMPLLAPIIVLEDYPGLGIRRAWDLTRRRFWWVLGFAFILTLFGQLLVTGPIYLVNIIFQFFVGNPMLAENPFTIFTWQAIAQSMVGLVFSLIYLPIQLTGMIHLYFDLRVRTEGLDLIFQSASDGDIGLEDIAAQAPPPEQGNWITMTEVGYFALFTLAVLLLFAILVGIGMMFGFAILAASGAPVF